MSVHITAAELAEAAEGLLDAARGAAVEEHVTGCNRCSQIAQALSQVPALLCRGPAVAMPDDVHRRLSGVLAAERRRSTDGASPAQQPGGRDNVPGE